MLKFVKHIALLLITTFAVQAVAASPTLRCDMQTSDSAAPMLSIDDMAQMMAAEDTHDPAGIADHCNEPSTPCEHCQTCMLSHLPAILPVGTSVLVQGNLLPFSVFIPERHSHIPELPDRPPRFI